MAAPEALEQSNSVLTIEGVETGYRNRPVVYDTTLRVGPGEIVALLGHNGAGKTTTIKTAFGMLRPAKGKVSLRGIDVTGASCATHVRLGMSYTPAERFVFSDLAVEVNLRLGALGVTSDLREQRLDRVMELFPILRERAQQDAGTFSGGQQRILSVGMALMSDPQVMLFDEPSLGVSPAITHQILSTLRHLADNEGKSVLLVEQNVGHALRESDRVYVMRSGRVILESDADEMRRREHYWDLF